MLPKGVGPLIGGGGPAPRGSPGEKSLWKTDRGPESRG